MGTNAIVAFCQPLRNRNINRLKKNMKLEKILDNLNSLEKNSFIKIIDNIIANKPKNSKEIEKIISETDKSGLKNLDNVVVSKIFELVENEFYN